MAALAVAAFRGLEYEVGEDGLPICVREIRTADEDEDDFDLDFDPGAEPTPTPARFIPPERRRGATSAVRSARSRREQENHIWDHYSGYVLAHRLRGFRAVFLRTPQGTSVAQGTAALRDLRVGLRRRFPYVDGLVLRRREDGRLVRVRGCGWFADYSLEASDDWSPHYSLMLGVIGYDAVAFEEAISELWALVLSKALRREYVLGLHDIAFGPDLHVGTVRYMAMRKETASGRNAHDFRALLGDELGTNWWHAWGWPCLKLVKVVKGDAKRVRGVSLLELRRRAVVLDDVRRGGRALPDWAGHFPHSRTGTPLHVLSGPWYGAAARYLVTGREEDLEAYRRELHATRRARRQARERETEPDFLGDEAQAESESEVADGSAGSVGEDPDRVGDGIDVGRRSSGSSSSGVRRPPDDRRTSWTAVTRRLTSSLRAFTAFLSSSFVCSGAAMRRAVVRRGRRSLEFEPP